MGKSEKGTPHIPFSRVADPGEVDPIPDPTLKKKLYLDPAAKKKKRNPDPQPCPLRTIIGTKSPTSRPLCVN